MIQQLTKPKLGLTHCEESTEDSGIDNQNKQTQKTYEESKCFPRNKRVHFMHIQMNYQELTPIYKHSQIIFILDLYLKIIIL